MDRQGAPVAVQQGSPSPEGVLAIKDYARDHRLPPGFQRSKTYHYLFNPFDARDPAQWLLGLVFAWPLLLLLLAKGFKKPRLDTWLERLAPLLLGFTGFVLSLHTDVGDILEAGYWTTCAGLALYSLHAARHHAAEFRLKRPGGSRFLRRLVVAASFSLGLLFPVLQLVDRFRHGRFLHWPGL